MIDFLRSWILNIVSLVIFIILIEMFIPSGKTKKFVNLISGFILLIAIINPLMGLFQKGIDLKEFSITSSNILDKKVIEENSKVLEDRQMKQIAEVYRKKVIKQLEGITKDIGEIENAQADIIINEDYKSESFGDIERVYFNISLKEKNDGVKPVAKIEKIVVDGRDIVKEDNSEDKKLDSKLRKQLEDRVNKLFGVESDSVIITLK